MAVSRINEAGLNVNQYGNRNVIINGAMQVAQRATQVTANVSNGYKTLDRMRYSENSLTTAEFTHEQVTDAPDGFGHSLKLTCTTAEGSVGADDACRAIEYRIEGQDLQQLQYGTSSAKKLTLSFHVKSSLTGTYTIVLRRTETQNRIISATYTINSANTWEYKTITFDGDTSSVITNDNARRLSIYWVVGAGSNFTSTDSTSWINYSTGGFHYGQTAQFQNTLNATWQVTGLQLEVGDTATDFEHRTFGDELARCERYFFKTYEYATSPGTASSLASSLGRYLDATQNYASVPLPTLNLRATPTTTIYNPNDGTVGEIRSDSTDHPAVGHSSIGQRGGAFIYANNSSITVSTSSRAHITFDAEL